MTTYRYDIFMRGTSLRVGSLRATSDAAAKRELKRQEKDTAKAFEVRQANEYPA